MDRKMLIICGITFLIVIGSLFVFGRRSSNYNLDDPSSLPAPSREFNNWQRLWEKQR